MIRIPSPTYHRPSTPRSIKRTRILRSSTPSDNSKSNAADLIPGVLFRFEKTFLQRFALPKKNLEYVTTYRNHDVHQILFMVDTNLRFNIPGPEPDEDPFGIKAIEVHFLGGLAQSLEFTATRRGITNSNISICHDSFPIIRNNQMPFIVCFIDMRPKDLKQTFPPYRSPAFSSLQNQRVKEVTLLYELSSS